MYYNRSDYHYELPPELIAQDPLKERSDSRLMVLDRRSGSVTHRHFYDLCDHLRSGDCLVFNDTRVIPARLLGVKEDTGGAVELLLLKRAEDDKTVPGDAKDTDGEHQDAAGISQERTADPERPAQIGECVWECLAKPGKKLRPGARVVFGTTQEDGQSNAPLRAVVLKTLEDGNRIVRFTFRGIWEEVLDSLGEMPLPPYIRHRLPREQRDRYQTVYAKNSGSAAAPTAGLHFTEELLKRISDMGVRSAYVTLHVGLGTFRPVKADNILDHHMHTEFCRISEEAAQTINETKKKGGRIICVGTTSVRTLESMSDEDGTVRSGERDTDIFIYPGYRFRTVDALITNFHLPESTLLMLVSAFATREQILEAYSEAVKEHYRFFSFGDAMLIL